MASTQSKRNYVLENNSAKIMLMHRWWPFVSLSGVFKSVEKPLSFFLCIRTNIETYREIHIHRQRICTYFGAKSSINYYYYFGQWISYLNSATLRLRIHIMFYVPHKHCMPKAQILLCNTFPASCASNIYSLYFFFIPIIFFAYIILL